MEFYYQKIISDNSVNMQDLETQDQALYKIIKRVDNLILELNNVEDSERRTTILNQIKELDPEIASRLKDYLDNETTIQISPEESKITILKNQLAQGKTKFDKSELKALGYPLSGLLPTGETVGKYRLSKSRGSRIYNLTEKN